jgi:hypothetical protein
VVWFVGVGGVWGLTGWFGWVLMGLFWGGSRWAGAVALSRNGGI